MKKRYLFFSFFVACLSLNLLLSTALFAQPSCTNGRYKNEIFSVNKTSGIKYGTATAVIYPPYVSETTTYQKDLYLELYTPVGDTLRKRPTIVIVYGGAFLVGSTLQPQIVDYCNAMAKRGYVVAAIDYRLGYNSLDGNTAIRAVYRASQDLKAAIRFLKYKANVYNIDTSLVFAGGNSAGGVTSLHAAYVNEIEREAYDIMNPTYGGGLFNNWSNLGCTECSGNNYGQSPYNISGSPDLVINLWGAIGDTSFMQSATDAPVISFHGTADAIVNPDYGSPFGYPVIPALYGSTPIHQRAQHLNLLNELHLYEGVGHEVWLDSGYAQEIQNFSADFMYQFMKPTTPIINASSNVCANAYATYSVTPQTGFAYCWSVEGGTIVGNNIGTTVSVQWGSSGGTLYVRKINKNLLESDAAIFTVPPPACGVPINLWVSNITANSARLNWTAINGTTTYTIQGRKAGTTNWTNLTANTNYKQLGSVLQNCKQYEWRVMANCLSGSCGYSSTNVFQTVCGSGKMDNSVTDENFGDYAALSIQPNPATYNTDINYWAEQNKTLKVVLYQTNGQVLMQQTYNATQGNNVFTLDLSGCNNGMYWLSVNDGTNWQQQKIVVVR